LPSIVTIRLPIERLLHETSSAAPLVAGGARRRRD
jgi:hypothetical protein